ncbi:MAG TPA: acylphosphatase [Candidatus Limnocylindrales bacterium]|nr:acylphosphatase [Candidatus Limnocylindrales bacterium]
MRDTTTNERLDATVRGRVHGVGFRVHVRRAARELGVTGWVANEPGARVRCVAEGRRADLERLLASLRSGPPAAAVEDVRAEWLPATGEFEGFDVRSGWHGGD